MEKYLSKQQIETYHNDGFLVVQNFASDKGVAGLRKAAEKIIEEFDMAQVRIFTTENQSQHMDRYFLESSDTIRCFFEEDAFDGEGNLKTEKHLAINKVGHAMHDLHPVFEKFSYQKKMFQMAIEVGLEDPCIVQSQYICKQPRIGAKVNPHIDSTFIYTEPLSCVGFWLALEDATVNNGCLFAEPGSHKKYPLQQRFVLNEDHTGTKFESISETKSNWNPDDMRSLEVKKGDLVILHGEVVHASHANKSTNSRHVYIIH